MFGFARKSALDELHARIAILEEENAKLRKDVDFTNNGVEILMRAILAQRNEDSLRDGKQQTAKSWAYCN